MLRRDTKLLISLETPDYQQKNVEGQVAKKAQADADLHSAIKLVSSFRKVKYTVLGVKTFGKKAQVSFRQELVAKLRAPNGRTARLGSLAQYRDTWIQTPRGWRLQFSETLSDKSTLNGRPI